MMIAPLYVGVTDPVERLRLERTAMERLKQVGQADGLFAMTALADVVPAGMQAAAGTFTTQNTLLNTVSTNVPGPQIPMYFRGHQLLSWYPLGPVSNGIGLFNAILSYNQKLTFGATADPRLLPDIWFYAQCLRESFEEVRDAAARAAAEADAATVVAESGATEPSANGAKSGRTNGRGEQRAEAASRRGR